jgi:hypothetical protein
MGKDADVEVAANAAGEALLELMGWVLCKEERSLINEPPPHLKFEKGRNL